MDKKLTYMVRVPGQGIVARALPSMAVAQKIAKEKEGKASIDPRSLSVR